MAVADVDPKRLALAEELGVKGYVEFRGHDRLADVEAIVVAGPTDQREAMLEAAIESGKPIFCEKPLAQTLDAVYRIKAAVEKQARFCSWVYAPI